jgi:hypothetical protein
VAELWNKEKNRVYERKFFPLTALISTSMEETTNGQVTTGTGTTIGMETIRRNGAKDRNRRCFAKCDAGQSIA